MVVGTYAGINQRLFNVQGVLCSQVVLKLDLSCTANVSPGFLGHSGELSVVTTVGKVNGTLLSSQPVLLGGSKGLKRLAYSIS